MEREQYNDPGPTYFHNNYPAGWEEYLRYSSEAFQTAVSTAYAINTLFYSSNGGTWSYNSGINYFNSNVESFIAGCVYNVIHDSWGSTVGGDFNSALSSFVLIQSQQYFTASLDGPGETYSLWDKAPKQDFSGFLGKLKYFLTGGYIDGFAYNMKGEVTGIAPITGMAPTPGFKGNINPNFLRQLEKQLAKDGINSIYKTYRSLQKNLLEHQEKLKDILINSSVEREIRTWERDLRTIEEFIKRLGL